MKFLIMLEVEPDDAGESDRETIKAVKDVLEFSTVREAISQAMRATVVTLRLAHDEDFV